MTTITAADVYLDSFTTYVRRHHRTFTRLTGLRFGRLREATRVDRVALWAVLKTMESGRLVGHG